MYKLQTSLLDVDGIGEKFFAGLKAKNITTVKDLLLNLPLHYIDRSSFSKIADLKEGEEKTFKAEVQSTSNFYRRPRSIQSATVKDETGHVKLMWFNNSYILKKLKKGETYLFSGKLGKKKAIIHPVVEDVATDTIHTGRIVPVYSTTLGLQIGRLRRILRYILANLEIESREDLSNYVPDKYELKPLHFSLSQLHYPENEESVVIARHRMAIEELLVLMQRSHYLKQEWQNLAKNRKPTIKKISREDQIPKKLPFVLTSAQKKVTNEILGDLSKKIPMNRLLIGDVGSGKTVVAGIAALHLLRAGKSVALIAPTKILATQHYDTLGEIFPKLPMELISTGKKADFSHHALFIGTHGVINRLAQINPALIIYDEQHRFGVTHRSMSATLDEQPHVLTMTATPIPRSLILTIFSHLGLSLIDEMPIGRLPTITKLVSSAKRNIAYDWIKDQVGNPQKQAIFVCPFINKSEQEGFELVSSVTEKFEELKNYFGESLNITMLHGKMTKSDQVKISQKLFSGHIDILVTTPIVEVGIDLPSATIIAIENAERFGLASLHQLRGRVGRRGQQGYCLLFTTNKSAKTKSRLEIFTKENSGMKLAEFDLTNRGAGDIFGFAQSGLDSLKFANWADLEQISLARKLYEDIETPLPQSQAASKKSPLQPWQPILSQVASQTDQLPLAN